jgi:hypothetical protein
MKQFLFLALLLIILGSCSTTRVVKPLEHKEVAVGFDFGGPIVDLFGTKIPVPFSSISGAYGVDSNMTVFAGLHTTALAFGNLQMDLGICRSIIDADGRRPGLSVSPIANFMFNFREGDFRLYPELDVNVHWQYSNKYKHYAYASVANWFDLAGRKAHNEPNIRHYIPNIALGHTFVRPKMRYTIEARWLAANVSNQNLVVNYNGIGQQGSLGIFIGAYRKF